jgi:ring-1,2-phenylacetyl-CoA epoxidase subunit PaaD
VVAKPEDRAREALRTVMDPGIPALSIVDLGILRDVAIDGDRVTVTITPTYSGCPAMKMIEDEISAALRTAGFTAVSIQTVLSPAWTTDWLTDEGKRKLRECAIAPPERLIEWPKRGAAAPRVACPRCGSFETEEKSFFGSTACKALYLCRSCGEPFDFLKPL